MMKALFAGLMSFSGVAGAVEPCPDFDAVVDIHKAGTAEVLALEQGKAGVPGPIDETRKKRAWTYTYRNPGLIAGYRCEFDTIYDHRWETECTRTEISLSAAMQRKTAYSQCLAARGWHMNSVYDDEGKVTQYYRRNAKGQINAVIMMYARDNESQVVVSLNR